MDIKPLGLDMWRVCNDITDNWPLPETISLTRMLLISLSEDKSFSQKNLISTIRRLAYEFTPVDLQRFVNH